MKASEVAELIQNLESFDQGGIIVSVTNPPEPEKLIRKLKQLGYGTFLRSVPYGIEVVITKKVRRETPAT